MAIELKDLTAIIDLPADIDSVDKVKEHFDKIFVARKLATEDDGIRSAITGEVFGKLNTKAAQVFGLKAGEIKDKKLEEIIELGAGRLSGKIKELEDASKNSNDETIQKLTKENQKLKTDFESTDRMLKEKDLEFTTYKTEAATREKNSWIDGQIQEAKKKVILKDKPTDLELDGYESRINKYKYDRNDKNEIIIMDQEGKQVPNAAKSGFMTLPELLEKIADDGGILKKNNSTTKSPFSYTPTKLTNGNGTDTPKRKIAAAAINNASR